MISALPGAPPFTHYFRRFWGYAGAKMLVIVVVTVVMSYVEGIGLSLFYPLFDTSGATAATSGPFTWLLSAAHIPMTPAGVLPLIVGVFLCKGLLQYSVFRYQVRLAKHVTAGLRRRALDSIARADFEQVTTTNAGFYANMIVGEVDRAADAFLFFVRALSPALSATVLFVMVWFLDWRLSIACVAIGLVMLGVTRLTGRVVRRHSIVISRESSRLTSLVIQIVQSFKYLRATGSYERLERRAWTGSEIVLAARQKSANASGFLNAMTQPLMVLFLGAMLYYRAVLQGEALASLFVLLLYFFRVMNEANQLQMFWQTFIGLAVSSDLVHEAAAESESAAEPNGAEPFAGLHDAIGLEHVDFHYRNGRHVLTGIDLQIAAKSTVAFVGASGAGKTTLADVLMGTLRATSGRVLFDGRDLAAMDLASLRARIGYVPQDAALFDDTIAANIAIWADGHTRDELREAARRAHCLEFIDALPSGFETPVGDRGVKLSGGQRQRLAIARELLRSPDLLVLDEATSALDSESEHAIHESIEQLKGKMTIVIIAHRLSTIRGADRVFVLADGAIVETGAFDELAARPDGRFRRMVELQQVAS